MRDRQTKGYKKSCLSLFNIIKGELPPGAGGPQCTKTNVKNHSQEALKTQMPRKYPRMPTNAQRMPTRMPCKFYNQNAVILARARTPNGLANRNCLYPCLRLSMGSFSSGYTCDMIFSMKIAVRQNFKHSRRAGRSSSNGTSSEQQMV